MFAGQDSGGNWGNWRTLFELKTGPCPSCGANGQDDLALHLYVKMDNGGKLYWSSDAQDRNTSSGILTYWQEDNTSVAVPVGQWFHFEVFLQRSGSFNNNGGRFWAAINGKTIADVTSSTQRPQHLDDGSKR